MRPLTDQTIFEDLELPLTLSRGESRFYYRSHRKFYKIIPLPPVRKKPELLYVNSINYVHQLSNSHYRRHHAGFLSIEYVQEGSLAVRQDGRAYLAEAGDIFLMQPKGDNEFRTGPGGYCVKISMTMDGPLLPAILEQSGLEQVDVLPQVGIRRFENLLQRFNELADKPAVIAFSCNSLLCYELFQFLSAPVDESALSERLSMLVSYLENTPDKAIPLEEMAKLCGYSCTYLIRCFRNHFGITPYQMHAQIRMRNAALLLLSHEELSIKEITQMAGYNNPLNFSTEFKKHFGVSPRVYRQHGVFG